MKRIISVLLIFSLILVPTRKKNILGLELPFKEDLKLKLISNAKNELDKFIYFKNFNLIENTPLIINSEGKTFISNFYNKDYLRVDLKDNKILIQGVSELYKSYSIKIIDRYENILDPDFYSTIPIRNNNFSKTIKLSDPSNIKGIVISRNRHIKNAYYPNELKLYFKDKLSGFVEAESYNLNKKNFTNFSKLDFTNYLDTSFLDDSFKSQLAHLSKSILKDSKTDYDKALAIHRWVSSNIYYDLDSLESKKRGPNDAFGTFINKKAVCEGYANLTLALCRINNLPCQLIYGYALGFNSEEANWTKDTLRAESNHAWNQVYIDGQWIILDTTWDSNNKFEHGSFIKDEASFNFFHPSLEYFSKSHIIKEIIDI